MDKRINCNDCPLFHVEVDTLCETYCSDMADYREELRADAIDEIKELFNEDLFNRYAWDDGTMNFNNCSLMILEILEQLKEQK